MVRWIYGKACRFTAKKPEGLEKARVKARDPFVVFKFYDDLKAVYDECLTPACLIFNTDESAFGMHPAHVRALGKKVKFSTR